MPGQKTNVKSPMENKIFMAQIDLLNLHFDGPKLAQTHQMWQWFRPAMKGNDVYQRFAEVIDGPKCHIRPFECGHFDPKLVVECNYNYNLWEIFG
jgi:hypothetical protein